MAMQRSEAMKCVVKYVKSHGVVWESVKHLNYAQVLVHTRTPEGLRIAIHGE